MASRPTGPLRRYRRKTVTDKTAPWGLLLLRLTLGLFFLAHAYLKLFVFGPAGTAGFFQSLGLPAVLAYLVIALELFGGLALVAGVYARYVALALLIPVLGSIYTPHFAAGFWFSNQGGGWEFPLFWALALVAFALLGDGPFAVKKSVAA